MAAANVSSSSLQNVLDLINLFKPKGGSSTTQTDSGGTTTTSQTDTESVSPDAVNAVVKSILEGTQGLAAVSSGQKSAGLYNSSTNSMLVNDLLARTAAEAAKLNKSTTHNVVQTTAPKTTTQVTTPQPQLNFGKTAAALIGNKLLGNAITQGFDKLGFGDVGKKAAKDMIGADVGADSYLTAPAIGADMGADVGSAAGDAAGGVLFNSIAPADVSSAFSADSADSADSGAASAGGGISSDAASAASSLFDDSGSDSSSDLLDYGSLLDSSGSGSDSPTDFMFADGGRVPLRTFKSVYDIASPSTDTTLSDTTTAPAASDASTPAVSSSDGTGADTSGVSASDSNSALQNGAGASNFSSMSGGSDVDSTANAVNSYNSLPGGAAHMNSVNASDVSKLMMSILTGNPASAAVNLANVVSKATTGKTMTGNLFNMISGNGNKKRSDASSDTIQQDANASSISSSGEAAGSATDSGGTSGAVDVANIAGGDSIGGGDAGAITDSGGVTTTPVNSVSTPNTDTAVGSDVGGGDSGSSTDSGGTAATDSSSSSTGDDGSGDGGGDGGGATDSGGSDRGNYQGGYYGSSGDSPLITDHADPGQISNTLFANGGDIPGHDTQGSDNIPIRVSGGEYVIPTDVVDKMGEPFFDDIVKMFHTPIKKGAK